jgi:hypothetical protein
MNNYSQSQFGTDNVYLTTSYKNNTNTVQQAKYFKTLTSVILERPYEYYLAIVRADFSALGVCILDYAGKENKFSVTLSYGGFDVQIFLDYILYVSPVQNSKTLTSYNKPIYNYQQFIDMLNNALQYAYTELTLVAGPLPVSGPPYVLYDPSGCIFLFQDNYNEVINGAPTVKVYFSYELYLFFPNLYGVLYSTDPTYVFGKNYELKVYTTPSTYPSTKYPGYDILIQQEYRTFNQWYDITNVVITSNTLPLANDTISVYSQSTNDNYISILLDLEPTQFGSEDPISRIIYIPQIYRLIDILPGSTKLKNIDWQIYIRSKDGMLREYPLLPNEDVNVKFVFIKKSSSVK